MLNLTRLHLGIAHESQFQGLGISPSYSKARRLSSNARSIDSATSVGRPCSYLVVAPQSHSIILLYRKSLRFRTMQRQQHDGSYRRAFPPHVQNLLEEQLAVHCS